MSTVVIFRHAARNDDDFRKSVNLIFPERYIESESEGASAFSLMNHSYNLGAYCSKYGKFMIEADGNSRTKDSSAYFARGNGIRKMLYCKTKDPLFKIDDKVDEEDTNLREFYVSLVPTKVKESGKQFVVSDFPETTLTNEGKVQGSLKISEGVASELIFDLYNGTPRSIPLTDELKEAWIAHRRTDALYAKPIKYNLCTRTYEVLNSGGHYAFGGHDTNIILILQNLKISGRMLNLRVVNPSSAIVFRKKGKKARIEYLNMEPNGQIDKQILWQGDWTILKTSFEECFDLRYTEDYSQRQLEEADIF
jgi:hypothetical protein